MRSSDGEAFEVDEVVVLESQTIKHMVEDNCADSVILLLNVTSKILVRVIEYCKKHVKASNSEEKTPRMISRLMDITCFPSSKESTFELFLSPTSDKVEHYVSYIIMEHHIL